MSDRSHNNVPHQAEQKPSSDWSARLSRWAAVIYQSFMHLWTDNGMMWAASIAYYALLSIFPLLLAVTSLAANFVEPEWMIDQARELLGDFLPVSEYADDIAQIVSEAIEVRGQVGLISIATLLWTGTRVFSALTIALNVAYDTDETYGFFKRTLIELAMLLTVGVIFVIAQVTPLVLTLLVEILEILPFGQGVIYNLISTAVPTLLVLLSFFLIYRFVPRRQQHWRSALSGAVVATILFVIARPLFFYYVTSLAQYNLIYGSIAIGIILLFWAWITALIMLFGGEIAGHVQELVIEEQPAEKVERMHRLRALLPGKVRESQE